MINARGFAPNYWVEFPEFTEAEKLAFTVEYLVDRCPSAVSAVQNPDGTNHRAIQDMAEMLEIAAEAAKALDKLTGI